LQRALKFKRFFRGSILIPFIAPTGLTTLGWWLIFDPTYSHINWVLANVWPLNLLGLGLAIPGVACAVLFAFTLCWNEFLYSLVFIQDQLEKTLSVGVVTELVRGDIYFWGSLMAACLTGSIPILIVYAFFMDYFVTGLTAGAIK